MFNLHGLRLASLSPSNACAEVTSCIDDDQYILVMCHHQNHVQHDHPKVCRKVSSSYKFNHNPFSGLIDTTVRPTVLPDSISSNTDDRSSSLTMLVTILSRWFGAKSLIRRSHK